MKGQKHLIECHCILPQYRSAGKPYHQFVVFSYIDDSDQVVHKHAKCNNCGVIHNVIDIGKSEILSGIETGGIIEKKDIELMIPSSVSNILNSYDADLPTWEYVLYLIEEGHWGSHAVISREVSENGDIVGKILKLNSPTQFRLEPYVLKQNVGG